MTQLSVAQSLYTMLTGSTALMAKIKGVRYDAKRQWTFLDCVPEVE